ncbi:MAG: DUF892 family protein [Actinobacteria bacterium]|nr:DUF892 family protein [Actinomycetota bacterium]
MARDLFVTQLRTAVWVEQALADEVLPDLIDRVGDPELARRLERHLGETREHVRVVRAVLHERAGSIEPLESPALLGLLAEHERLPESDLAHCAAAAASEHLELALYESLASTAEALGEEAVGLALRELMEQESFALEELSRSRAKLLAEAYARP